MSSQGDVSNVDIDVFQYAQLTPEEFHANVLKLGDKGIQQGEMEKLDFENNPSEPLKFRSIEEIVKNTSNQAKEQLGKNLLDSFALIFAQSGSDGVTATIMKSDSREPNEFVLYVAKNHGENGSLSDLATDIERWFITGDPNVNSPSATNPLWDKILHHCYFSIKKEIYERFFSKIRNISGQDECHFRFVRELIRRVASDEGMPPVAKGLLSVLDVAYYLSDYSLSASNERLTPANNPLIRSSANIHLIYKLTNLCYELRESYDKPMQSLLLTCEKRIREGWTYLNGLQLLIQNVANYLRAWYDMVRFKLGHSSATLRIVLVPRDQPSKMNIRKIVNAGVANGVLGSEDEETFINRHRPSRPSTELSCPERDYEVSFWVHCEMQILEFLLTSGTSNFYNYIGSSKGPCWLCYHTLTNMVPGCKMRQSHLKLYPAWLPPTFEEGTEESERFPRVLRALNSEILRLIRLGAKCCSHTNADCPDIKEIFVSPKTEKLYQLTGGS